MFPCKALLSLIFISLTAVDANLLIRSIGQTTLTVATRINGNGARILVERDQIRAKFLQAGGQEKNGSPSFSDANIAVAYTTEVGVGSPPNNYTLMIDTASGHTWVGARASKPYIPTSTSKDTGDTVNVTYGSAHFSGEEWVDTVTLSPDLVVEKQSIGVANASNGFSDYDGMLGLGPVDLTIGKVKNEGTVPTVLNNLVSQGTISQEVIAFYCVPVSEKVSNGTITFGGYDSSVVTDPIKYVPLTTKPPASKYWGIEQSIHYGDTLILSTNAGIVDTGTTLILLATDAYKKYQSATGSVLDLDTGFLTIDDAQYAALKTLSFNIGDGSYDLTPNAQIWPRSLNTVIGGNSDSIYLVVSDLGTNSGSGFDFALGFTFLERYYSIFDATNKRMGFAPTAHTKVDTN